MIASPAPGPVAQPVSLNAYESYIKALLETKDSDKIKFFQEALQANPGYARAGYRLAVTLQRSGKYRESNDVLKETSVSGSWKSKSDFIWALNLYHMKDYETAINGWTGLAERAPSAEVYNNIAVGYQKQNKPAEALWYFSKAVQADPQFADYHFNIAGVYFQKQDLDPAIYHFREAVRLKPNDYQALFLLAKSLEKKQPQAAMRVQAFFRETLPTDKQGKSFGSTPALLRLSPMYLTAEERQYRNQTQKMKMNQLASYVEAYKNNARRYIDDGNPEKAMLEAKKGVSLSRLDWHLHYLLGRAYFEQKQLSEATSELHFSLWCLANVDSHLLLADIYRRSERYEDAKLQIQQTLALDPKNKRAMEIWSKIYNKVRS